jgi:protein-L-isoaspartate(D-aspartate) O-methyltransferase
VKNFYRSLLREFAYEDSPLPIAEGQTVSQPYIVALADALLVRGGEQVLEIGTGSGYAAAVLAEIAANVYSVERIGQMAEKAAVRLAKLGYDNVHVLHADGTRGCQSTRRTMRLSSLLAVPEFHNHSNSSSRSVEGW